ncbi:phosphoglycolate phosphatase [Gymnodinialimonas ceratoperidinii]|uniref:Phosphoglycolate phosphatase n=1 Tax=Gymnodinialimonas ceratoperidinii TaxID=2856823 RepID=A0A8F6YBX0_9RHOB|nr:phosphoglycolate phosphatase [Gymnodinialimonas ceratoperidinii]QXT38617.1 phosphoglycolate phosphatase [Gymnodinialimonas ceratoperidinii]
MARIVFDLDGTLIDSVPDIAAAANATLAEVGVAPLSLAEARGFVGEGAGVFVERMAQARGLSEPARLMPRFLHHYERAVGLTEIYPGVAASLDALARAGHRLGLCTNKPARPTEAVLAHLGWQERFEVVLAGDSLPSRKPDPAPLRAAFDALGDGPMIYVGDSEIDAEAARRAGVPFLIYTPGYRSADLQDLPHAAAFDDWSEVLAIVATMA